MRSLNLLILLGQGWKSLKIRKSRSATLSYKKRDGHSVVITKASSLSTTYKILSNILLSCLIPFKDDFTVGHLCWHWHNRSTADHILCLLQILEKKWEWGFKQKPMIQYNDDLVWYCDWVWYPYKITSVDKVCLNKTYSKIWTCKPCLICLLLRMVLKKEMLHNHCFSTLL